MLASVLNEISGDEIEIGALMKKLRRRSFGGVFLILAIIGLVPGISVLSGLAMLMPALQLVVGFQAPRFPHIIAERSVDANLVKKFGLRTIKYIEYLERFVRPRWLWLSTEPAPALMGAVIFCLAFILMIPLPFSNFLPAVALICFALGLMERDGVIICAGLIVAVFAIVFGWLAVVIAVRALVPGAAE